jgi:hypothetical protein
MRRKPNSHFLLRSECTIEKISGLFIKGPTLTQQLSIKLGMFFERLSAVCPKVIVDQQDVAGGQGD